MAIVLALISAVVYGASDYCGGRAARAAPVLAVSLIALCASLGVSGALLLLGSDPFPPPDDVAWGAAGGCMSLLGGAAFYFALSNGAMTVVAPVTAVISALVPVAVGVAIGERPSAVAVAGIVLAVVAVALVSGLTGRIERSTPAAVAVMAVVAGMGFGLLFVFLDRTSDASGLWPVVIGQATAIPIVAAIVLARGAWFERPRYSLALAAGAMAAAANICYLLATRRGLLSLVAVITAMYPASTVALATMLDHERLSRSQVVGLGLAVAALGMVTAGGG